MKKILSEENFSEFTTTIDTIKAKNKIFKALYESIKKRRKMKEEHIINS
jgi:hypothetical protein